ncbi:MAG: bifunctional riboflavin kinase/FAD synthetase [bacterium]|nr:bifunctional riboflavin kinase/FAD synthetase [bacterium]
MKNAKKPGEYAIAIGSFDGLHLGHREIINALKKFAAENNLASMILTFVPNPKAYFDKELKLINTESQKKEGLETLEVDRCCFLNFADVLEMQGRQFIKNLLIDRFNMKYLVMGENFKFGKNRETDIDSLTEMGRQLKFEFCAIKPVVYDGKRVSSSLIRETLAAGEIQKANRMLGRLYCIDGIITDGAKVGRTLGFPTINIQTENRILPIGVFKTRVEIDAQSHDSITSIGTKPTFGGKDKVVETHIFDFDQSIYGNSARLFFQKKVRDEIKFASKERLVEQIKIDIEEIRDTK